MDSQGSVSDKDLVMITDVEAVSSYNWLDTETPTIAVPGMPAKWRGRDDTPILKPDSLPRYMDQNAGRWPSSSFEPGIRAVLHQQPEFDFTILDLVTDRYALAKLLEHIREPDPGPTKPKSFKISKSSKDDDSKGRFSFVAEIVGSTVLFVNNDAALETIDAPRGYRKDFEDKYLMYAQELHNSISHHRITSYQFGELKVLMRHALDGYELGDLIGVGDQPGQTPSSGNDQQASGLVVQSKGTLIPQSAILEFTTCKKNDQQGPRMDKKFREAWLSQCPRLITARQETMYSGTHWTDWRATIQPSDINPHDAAELNHNWAVNNQDLVKAFYNKVQGLMRDIRSAAANGQATTYIVTCAGTGKDIVFMPLTDVPRLPDELRSRMTTQIA